MSSILILLLDSGPRKVILPVPESGIDIAEFWCVQRVMGIEGAAVGLTTLAV